MDQWEKELKRFREQDAVPDPARLRETVQRAQSAFYEHEARYSVPWLEFLFQQSRYIRKRWWVYQGLLLALLWWLLCAAHSVFSAQRCVGILAPVFVILVIPELWKNQTAGALEVEGCTFYLLRQMFAARMIVFALVDCLLLSLFWVAVSCCVKAALAELALQFFLPFTVTCCICFRTLCCGRNETEALALCLVWVVLWVQLVLSQGIYEAISCPIWCGLLLGAAVYLSFCVARTQKNWQTIWEEAPSWN